MVKITQTNDKEISFTIDRKTALDLLLMLYETGEYLAAGAHFEVPPTSMKRLLAFYKALGVLFETKN